MYCVVYCLSLAPVTPWFENIKILIIISCPIFASRWCWNEHHLEDWTCDNNKYFYNLKWCSLQGSSSVFCSALLPPWSSLAGSAGHTPGGSGQCHPCPQIRFKQLTALNCTFSIGGCSSGTQCGPWLPEAGYRLRQIKWLTITRKHSISGDFAWTFTRSLCVESY